MAEIQWFEGGKEIARFVESLSDFVVIKKVSNEDDIVSEKLGTIRGIPFYLNHLMDPEKLVGHDFKHEEV